MHARIFQKFRPGFSIKMLRPGERAVRRSDVNESEEQSPKEWRVEILIWKPWKSREPVISQRR